MRNFNHGNATGGAKTVFKVLSVQVGGESHSLPPYYTPVLIQEENPKTLRERRPTSHATMRKEGKRIFDHSPHRILWRKHSNTRNSKVKQGHEEK